MSSGGALVWSGLSNSLYAFRGGSTLELWTYRFPTLAPAVDEYAAVAAPAALSLRLEPNPSAAATRVRFVLPRPARVSVKLYDAAGAVRAVLVEGCLPAGPHGLDVAVPALPKGVYLLRLDAEGRSTSVKLVRS